MQVRAWYEAQLQKERDRIVEAKARADRIVRERKLRAKYGDLAVKKDYRKKGLRRGMGNRSRGQKGRGNLIQRMRM